MINSKSIIINYRNNAMLIPFRCLKWINSPKYIGILLGDKKHKMLVLYAISDDLEDRVKNVISKEELISPFYAVPDAVYDNKDCFLGIISEKMPDFMTVMTDIVDGTNEFDRKKC